MANNEELYINGLNAKTGLPLIGSISYKELTEQILANYTPEKRRQEARYQTEAFAQFGEYKLDDPKEAGWGLLVNSSEADEMKELLAPLISHRQGRVLLYNGEPAIEWIAKNRAYSTNPSQFPFYILIAGSPSKVPYELQFALDVSQAVGRIDFNNPADYSRYAQMVVGQETDQLQAPEKRVVFFAPQLPSDSPTLQSCQRLAKPLRQQLPDSVPSDLVYTDLLGADATKSNLIQSLTPNQSGQTPAIVFAASHGAGIENIDPDQQYLQGSIVCQDHMFPLTPEKRDGFISGYDVNEGFSIPGGILFVFACFGAGTRAHSDFARYLPEGDSKEGLKAVQGTEDFVGYLPKALLANINGGSLAVIGHVDPAWLSSFVDPLTNERRIFPFGFAMARLLRGKPVGFSVSAFNEKYAETSTGLLSLIEDMEEEAMPPDQIQSQLADLWICRNDAQNYIVIGDPAVRLKFE
jgi:hypothetical protein